MSKFSVLLAIALCAAAVSAAQNVCKIGNIINRPGNSQPIYWPSTWRENQTAPHLAKGQSCSWIVTIPQGYYAKLIIDGKVNDTDSRFQLIDSVGNVVQTTVEKMHPYYLPGPKFTLIVSNETPARFAFKVVWAQYPTKIEYDMFVDRIPQLINITKNVLAAEYNAPTGISLLAFPADRKNYFSLRSTLIFEGNDFNGNFVSNLYQLYQTRKQWISSGTGIYAVNLEAQNVLDELLIQAAGYTKDIQEYVELICTENNTTCSATVNGGHKKSALISLDWITNVLTDIKMDVSSTLTVYYGSPTDFGLYKTFSGSNITSQLPLTFSGYITQYVINSGKATFNFTVSNGM